MQDQTHDEPQVLDRWEVTDAAGTPCPAYDRYKRGEITVICNQTGAMLRVPQIHNPAGELMLAPGESADLEDYMRPSAIEVSGVTQMLRDRTASFSIHKKGSTPVGKARDVQSGPTGRLNAYDEKLDEVAEKEKREDERTARKHTRRTGPSGSVSQHSRE